MPHMSNMNWFISLFLFMFLIILAVKLIYYPVGLKNV